GTLVLTGALSPMSVYTSSAIAPLDCFLSTLPREGRFHASWRRAPSQTSWAQPHEEEWLRSLPARGRHTCNRRRIRVDRPDDALFHSPGAARWPCPPASVEPLAGYGPG